MKQLIVGMILLAALCGCGNHTPSRSRDGTRTADSAATQEPTGATIYTTIVALGNEPFWNVRVTAREIRYTGRPPHTGLGGCGPSTTRSAGLRTK